MKIEPGCCYLRYCGKPAKMAISRSGLCEPHLLAALCQAECSCIQAYWRAQHSTAIAPQRCKIIVVVCMQASARACAPKTRSPYVLP